MGNDCMPCGSSQLLFFPLKEQFQPFFDGQILKERMQTIRRKFIEPIRKNYNRQLFNNNIEKFKIWFAQYKKEKKEMKQKKYLQQELKIRRLDLNQAEKRIIRISKQKNQKQEREKEIQKEKQEKQIISNIKYLYWDDFTSKQEMSFGMIRAFTNQTINQSIIRLINCILRQKQMYNQRNLQLAVFLIQTMNIELYLLTISRPQLNNYQGQVYRGISCNQQDFNKFMKIVELQDKQKRVISVPLSLWSASKNLDVAQFFIRQRRDNHIKIILCINVISLNQEDLQLYRQTFPTSVVSTICSVDISHPTLHQHPDQEQVLLRGAFCMVLDIQRDVIKASPLQVYHRVHCVMVNANRDHISTNNLGEKADDARKLFAAIANKARMKFAHEYYDKKSVKNSQYQYFQEKEEMQEKKIQHFRQFRRFD